MTTTRPKFASQTRSLCLTGDPGDRDLPQDTLAQIGSRLLKAFRAITMTWSDHLHTERTAIIESTMLAEMSIALNHTSISIDYRSHRIESATP